MIKLIASDLDGTLLDNNGNIQKEFGSIIEELNLKNIKFFKFFIDFILKKYILNLLLL